MLKLKINNIEVKVPEGLSVMAAARLKGIDVPSMCYREGKPHFTSCMICMVKDNKNGKLFPSCSVKATEGMDITTIDEEIEESRRMALELLLSEHVGDCEAPCQITCPAHMDIPLMNRLLAEGKFSEALKVVKNDIALPAVFGRICPAPCEGACRRKSVDSAVSICLLKRYAGDHELEHVSYVPQKAASSGKKVAILGAGPTGLAAAYYLQLRGHSCTIFDRNKKPGGSLWSEVEAGKLEAEILEKEIALIENLQVEMKSGVVVDDKKIQSIQKDFDAVLIATGSGVSGAENFGLNMTDKGIDAEKGTYCTSNEKIFAAGSAVRPSKLAIRCLGQGKEAAFSIDQYLNGKTVSGEPFVFNSRFGKLMTEEVLEYLKESHEGDRLEPSDAVKGFTREEVMEEAARCMHCDCRAIDNCTLRTLSDDYKANQKHYWSEERRMVKKVGTLKTASSSKTVQVHNKTENKPAANDGDLTKQVAEEISGLDVIYEPNKCIKCGKCVHICEERKEKYGMSFIGRGFDAVVGVPFGEELNVALAEVAEEVVRECPTGALSRFA